MSWGPSDERDELAERDALRHGRVYDPESYYPGPSDDEVESRVFEQQR